MTAAVPPPATAPLATTRLARLVPVAGPAPPRRRGAVSLARLGFGRTRWATVVPPPALAPRAATLAAIVLVFLLVASGAFYRWAGEGRTIGLGEEPLWYPHRAVEFAGKPGMPDRFLAYHIEIGRAHV